MRWVVFALLSFMVGCAGNPYKKHYVAVESAYSLAVLDPFYSETLKILPFGEDIQASIFDVQRDGYVYLGTSKFAAEYASAEELEMHAKEIGADLVLVASQYVRTDSGVTPVEMPAAAFSYHSGYMFSGTTFIPYSKDRYLYEAAFFVKTKLDGWGVSIKEPPLEVRKARSSNKGALVYLIRYDAPMYKAGLIEGDVITLVNGHEVTDPAWFESFMAETDPGSLVSLRVYRDGQYKDFEFRVGVNHQ